MIGLKTLLLIAAAVCFLLAVFNVPAKINLVALGLFFWVVTLFVY